MAIIDHGKKESGFPILFDCSCSGIQHLSAMCSDISVAKMVNVLSHDDGIKSDIYQLAADSVVSEISNRLNPKLEKYRIIYENLIINRKLMKIPIMTIPYNITLNGASDKIEDSIVEYKFYENNMYYYKIKSKFIKNSDINMVLDGVGFHSLCAIIYTSLYGMAPILGSLISYFNKMSKLLSKIDVPIIWITPSKMKINMSVRVFESKKTKTRLNKTSKPVTISIPTNMIDVKSNVRGFVANLIHSMDASHINLIIKNMKQNNSTFPIYTIHDCFATTPNNMFILNNIVLSSFVEQYYSENYITKLHQNLLDTISSYDQYKIVVDNGTQYIIGNNTRLEIPKIPQEILDNWEKNKPLFIKGILQSSYFIS